MLGAHRDLSSSGQGAPTFAKCDRCPAEPTSPLIATAASAVRSVAIASRYRVEAPVELRLSLVQVIWQPFLKRFSPLVARSASSRTAASRSMASSASRASLRTAMHD